jgi:hypothetical protein
MVLRLSPESKSQTLGTALPEDNGKLPGCSSEQWERLLGRSSASLKATPAARRAAAPPMRPSVLLCPKFTVVFYGQRIFCCKTAQSSETARQYACVGPALENRLRNITKSCAKTR